MLGKIEYHRQVAPTLHKQPGIAGPRSRVTQLPSKPGGTIFFSADLNIYLEIPARGDTQHELQVLAKGVDTVDPHHHHDLGHCDDHN